VMDTNHYEGGGSRLGSTGMLRGKLIGLRARLPQDVDILHAELYDDVGTRVRADNRVWVPLPPGPASPYWVSDQPGDAPRSSDAAIFSVVELATGDLAGDALLWGIDPFNRSAHVGMSLRPSFRGRGLAVDVARVLCRYGFAIRGLHRLQIETLSDNHAMIAVAGQAGFVQEGVTRRSAWVNGDFTDVVIFGLLADEFSGGARVLP
jgi:RimJ/RimL family protein N-acetyltransferase